MKALIVRGGWDGHRPVESTELFVPFLRDNGFEVRIEESPAVYADAASMAETDLIVQCVTMSEITAEQVAGLQGAVAAGTGLTGWHGGIADSYRASADYLHLVAVRHPPGEGTGTTGRLGAGQLPGVRRGHQ
jgi:type 1 glutamine amidotransferase